MRSIYFLVISTVFLVTGLIVFKGYYSNDDNSGYNEKLGDLEHFIENSRKIWQVPGLAVSVIKGDNILFQKGFGTRDIEYGGKVDTHTMFAIGSATKAFTVTALGILADEGKVDWMEPVITYMPDFGLSDDWISRHITLHDMLSHQSGLNGGDADKIWVWSEGYLSRKELLRRLKYQPFSYEFRTTFSYHNLLYLASGEVIPAVTGIDWDTFIATRLFAPLGMHASNTSITALEGIDNVAMPHLLSDKEIKRISYRNIDTVAPAGAINSNIKDMTQWLMFQIQKGKVNESVLVNPENIIAMRKPKIMFPIYGENKHYPGAHFVGYSYAWFLHDYKGIEIIEHGGNIDGMTALVAMIPEKEIGLVVLSNLNNTHIREVIMYEVFDRLLGNTSIEWNNYFQQLIQDGHDPFIEQNQTQMPTCLLSNYTGQYYDDFYGNVTIGMQEQQLTFTYQEKTVILEHWVKDIFRRPYWSIETANIELVRFETDKNCNITVLEDDTLGVLRKQ